MSNGNAERPPAQAPRSHDSAHRVEVSAEGRQSAPTANAQGQESTNGQSRVSRQEQLATTRAGAAAARTGRDWWRSSGRVARALRRSSRNTKPRSRHRRNRLLRSRRNRSRIHRRRLSRSKQNRRQLRHDRNRRPVARPRTLPLRRSRVLHPRRQGSRCSVRPLVPYPYGIRRRRQHLNKASGRGWGLVGRPSCLRTMWQLHLRSNLGFLPCSLRQPHLVGRMRRLRSHVRVLRPGSRLVRRCSRGPLERRLGASLEHLLLRALQRQPVWRLQQRLRSVRRRQPDSLARPHCPQSSWRADRPYARRPQRTSWCSGRSSRRTTSAHARRTGRSSDEDAGSADAATSSGANPGA